MDKILKDQVAQTYGYADYHQIDCLEIEEGEKDAIRVSILEQVILRLTEGKQEIGYLINSPNFPNG